MKKDLCVNGVSVFLALIGMLLAAGAWTGQMAAVNDSSTVRHIMAVAALTLAAGAFGVGLGLWKSANWSLPAGKFYLAALIVFTIIFMNVSDSAIAANHSGWLLVLLEVGSLSYLVYASGIQSAGALEYPPGMLG